MPWEIIGYDSTNEIYRETIPEDYEYERVEEILRRLVCVYLSEEEIVSASRTVQSETLSDRESEETIA